MARNSLMVLTPPGWTDSGMAVAACRAGARGVLDLEYACSPADAEAALARLARYAPAGFGVRVSRDAGELLPVLLALPPGRLAWVVLAGEDHPGRPDWVARLRRRGAEVLLEAVSLAEAVRAEEAGADG